MLYFPKTASNGRLIDSNIFQFPTLSIATVLVLVTIFSGLVIFTMMVFPGIPVPSRYNISPGYTMFGSPLISSFMFSVFESLFSLSPNLRLIFFSV